MKKIILSADSTCDLGTTLIEKYDVNIQPLHINLGEIQYKDGVDITPDDIYKTYEQKKILPQTSAPNPGEYMEYFKQWTDAGHEVIHVSLGSGISSSHQNAQLAAEELGNVHVVDSGNLSTGMGLLVLEAADKIAAGQTAVSISEQLNNLKPHMHTSFVIDQLTYLHEGGRCSALAAFSASVFNIKPCIEVSSDTASMTVGKKYRGSTKKVLKKYIHDKLSDRQDVNEDRIFITHSGTSAEIIAFVKDEIQTFGDFKEILITRTGCTITSHCGPNTVGVVFMTK